MTPSQERLFPLQGMLRTPVLCSQMKQVEVSAPSQRRAALGCLLASRSRDTDAQQWKMSSSASLFIGLNCKYCSSGDTGGAAASQAGGSLQGSGEFKVQEAQSQQKEDF